MKQVSINAVIERRILASMIVNKPFLAGLSQDLDPELFPSRYARIVAGWVAAFYSKYQEAPGRAVEGIYQQWVEDEKPPVEDQENVEVFLDGLSREYDETAVPNTPFLLDQASKYLVRRSVVRLHESLAAGLEAGREPADLMDMVKKYRPPNFDGVDGIDFLNDTAFVDRLFAEPQETLISFPGEAAGFFDAVLKRDTLVGIQGPEKRGKTWWCDEFAFRALRSRRRVALFQVGDLSETQHTMRLAMRMAGLPFFASDKPVRVPASIRLVDGEEGKEAEVTFREVVFPSLTPADVWQAQDRYRRLCGAGTKPRLMTSVHPTSSINVAGINRILEKWWVNREFAPDVIVIDYADILAPETRRQDEQERIDETWKELRKLSQVWHACVIAPTQANAQAYEARTQSMKHFSRDKRKYAHVTAMIGLNQTEEERESQVMRLNLIVARETPFNPTKCLWVAQCLPLGMAFVKAAR